MAMNVLVTAGGTMAPIDDVRHIANASTGRFGAMIAEAALRRGAHVWHLHAPGALRPFGRLARFDLDSLDPSAEIDRLHRLRDQWLEVRDRCHPVPLIEGTVAEYSRKLEELLRLHPIDVAYLAMAASDFAPEPHSGKLSSSTETLVLRCRRLPKVIESVRDWSPSTYLVGFKLLSQASEAELIRQAGAAGTTNRADLTVANDLRTVRAGRHVIHLVRPGHPTETFGPDEPIADLLVDRSFAWASARGTRSRPGA
jgi:phosphopantothenate---cysteine ligase (CTP)